MTTYEVLVSDELLSDFTNDNPRMPEGFRIIGAIHDRTGNGSKWFRVQDDNAPAWTEGKRIEPIFLAEYETGDPAKVSRVVVTDWREVSA